MDKDLLDSLKEIQLSIYNTDLEEQSIDHFYREILFVEDVYFQKRIYFMFPPYELDLHFFMYTVPHSSFVHILELVSQEDVFFPEENIQGIRDFYILAKNLSFHILQNILDYSTGKYDYRGQFYPLLPATCWSQLQKVHTSSPPLYLVEKRIQKLHETLCGIKLLQGEKYALSS